MTLRTCLKMLPKRDMLMTTRLKLRFKSPEMQWTRMQLKYHYLYATVRLINDPKFIHVRITCFLTIRCFTTTNGYLKPLRRYCATYKRSEIYTSTNSLLNWRSLCKTKRPSTFKDKTIPYPICSTRMCKQTLTIYTWI